MKHTPVSDDALFLEDFARMSIHGATSGGGVEREAGTEADRHTRAWFAELAVEYGAHVHQDAIGNQFALFELFPDAPYIMVGSHLDSQPLAGRFDGAYGVLAGAHAARRIARRVAADDIRPAFNVAVVNWFNEEGSRFAPSMMGSSVFTGKLALETALEITDRHGVSVREALADELVDRDFRAPDVAGYAEIHVEQGRILENAGETIGLVESTWGAKKFRVRVLGEQGHTGSTIMRDRRDALYGAAKFIVAAREITEEFAEGLLHSSVSELELAPGSPVTLAREVEINLDLRSADVDVLERAERRLFEEAERIEGLARVRIQSTPTHEWGLLAYPEQGVELARRAAQKLGLGSRRVKTVAGHDSTNMKDVVPTVMLFVPSVEGISHNEAEMTRDEDMLDGVRVLTEVLAEMVCRPIL